MYLAGSSIRQEIHESKNKQNFTSKNDCLISVPTATTDFCAAIENDQAHMEISLRTNSFLIVDGRLIGEKNLKRNAHEPNERRRQMREKSWFCRALSKTMMAQSYKKNRMTHLISVQQIVHFSIHVWLA